MPTATAADRFEQSIHRFIEKMYELLMKCKDRSEKIRKLTEQLLRYDSNNPDFKGLIDNTRENNKMYMYVIIWILCILLDFFLLFNGLTLLSNRSNLSLLLKISAPILLVSAEVVISYFAILRQSTGEHVPWLSKNLQYFVIAVLVAFSIIVILYSAQGYNPQFDGSSFWLYLFSSIITQVVLLIPAIMLHLWIIKNAEEIAEALAYFKYRAKRGGLAGEIEHLEKLQRRDQKQFVQWAHSLVQQMNSYKRKHPNARRNFAETMPQILIKAINAAMGRRIFDEDNSSDSSDFQNQIV